MDDKPDLLDALRHYDIDVQPSRIEQVCICANPDHDETQPSMTVNSVKQVYSCKACGFQGDVYTLIQKRERTESFASTLDAARRIFGSAGVSGGGPQRQRGRVGLSGKPGGGFRPGFRKGLR